MADTWHGAAPPPPPPIGPLGVIRLFCRALLLVPLVFGGLLLLLLVRLIERPLCGPHRPVTPYITQSVCRVAFVPLNIRFTSSGDPMVTGGAMVANHASWLDIFALNARARIYFVAKSEVAGWPAIGLLARATGTLFIRRDRAEVRNQIAQFTRRIGQGHRLLFFPEGTSSDGLQVLPFKPSLFAAFLAPELRDAMHIQPITVTYSAPPDYDPRFYGWWGDMGFADHLIRTLAARGRGGVHVAYHAPLRVADYGDRKTLAAALEAQVRAGLTL